MKVVEFQTCVKILLVWSWRSDCGFWSYSALAEVALVFRVGSRLFKNVSAEVSGPKILPGIFGMLRPGSRSFSFFRRSAVSLFAGSSRAGMPPFIAKVVRIGAFLRPVRVRRLTDKIWLLFSHSLLRFGRVAEKNVFGKLFQRSKRWMTSSRILAGHLLRDDPAWKMSFRDSCKSN